MPNFFNEVKKYCSENVTPCRLCEKEPWFTKIRERIKNKDATWTNRHLPYIGPRFGVRTLLGTLFLIVTYY